MPFSSQTLLLLLPIALATWSTPVTAQVRHCITPDGQHIFTDRECAALGGTEQVQPRQPVAAATQARRGGCARNIDDLVFEMTSAFDAHDANRLAGVYHWTGMSGTSAYNVMARLDTLVQRPLERFAAWMERTGAENTAWIVGIIGFLIARSAATELGIFDALSRLGG